jgi:hypothetical protein
MRVCMEDFPVSLEHSPARQGLRPRFGRVPAALTYAAVSRSRFYEWAQTRPELIRKNGTASIVDFNVLDEILDSLPVAELKAPPDEAA